MRILLIGGHGYVGSRLASELHQDIHIVDCGMFGIIPKLGIDKRCDYDQLDFQYLNQFDAIILLAGHSSVGLCDNAPPNVVCENNIAKFIRLVNKLDRQKFIYASSSSVYGHSLNAAEDLPVGSAVNLYDWSKDTIDRYMMCAGRSNWYGLRFGTVCGFSPNLRSDLMINSMVHGIRTQGEFRVGQRSINRPILGLSDLCRAVTVILQSDMNAGVYNLASFNTTVGTIAYELALMFPHARMLDMGSSDNSAYSFSISVDKFQRAFQFEFSDTVCSIATELMSRAHDVVLEGGRQ